MEDRCPFPIPHPVHSSIWLFLRNSPYHNLVAVNKVPFKLEEGTSDLQPLAQKYGSLGIALASEMRHVGLDTCEV